MSNTATGIYFRSRHTVHREMYSGEHAAISMANYARDQGYRLKFLHQATGHSVEFPAILQSLSDTHTPEQEQRIFANATNPLITQGSTGREINFTFKVLNGSIEEARYNRESVNMLLQFLFPSYHQDGSLRYAPFITVSKVSLLNDGSESIPETECIIQNITYTLNTTEGYIAPNKKELYPISLTISVSAVTVIPSSPDRAGSDTPYPSTYPKYR